MSMTGNRCRATGAGRPCGRWSSLFLTENADTMSVRRGRQTVKLIGETEQQRKQSAPAQAPTLEELSDIRPLMDVSGIPDKQLAWLLLRGQITPHRIRIEDQRRAFPHVKSLMDEAQKTAKTPSKDLARGILRKEVDPSILPIRDLRRAGECMAEVAPDTIETEPDVRSIIPKPVKQWYGG